MNLITDFVLQFFRAAYPSRRSSMPLALDRHFRTEISDVVEVVRAVVGFLQRDPTLTARFA